mgnify:CR=1 FL=1
MNTSQPTPPEPKPISNPFAPPENENPALAAMRKKRREAIRWWVKVTLQPVLFLVCVVTLLVGLGVAQRFGFFDADVDEEQVAAADPNMHYICPMMCTPPLEAPGRCPVCGMELIAVAKDGPHDKNAVQISSAARRVANIQTVAVRGMPVTRTVNAIGELSYDEGGRKTLVAYVDGRVEKLYADYTGVLVGKGDELALLYSPKLYTSQVSYLLALKSLDQGQSSTLQSVAQSNQEMVATSKRRLQEMGMSDQQIKALEESGEAVSRIKVNAPISGTVIDKLVTEGQSVMSGQPMYELADLTTVWLMLRLFPEDAAAIRYGQRVAAEVDSLPGEEFIGRVAFIDPNVDPETRTVGVRVVVPNPIGRLRIGDYAKARIDVPLSSADRTAIYDPELAHKWISPRHPHIIAAEPGDCPLCGVALVPASEYGFTDEPTDASEAMVIPRDAVLMAGNSSLVYVETEAGRFEIRQVVLGPMTGDQIVIRDGVTPGEMVAARGNFLIDSAMQLAGNPSLIDPTRLQASPATLDQAAMEQLAQLSPDDRTLAEHQRICPVTDLALGSMGVPLKLEIDGHAVFICCQGCEDRLRAEPAMYLAKLSQPSAETTDQQQEFAAELAKLSPEDRAIAEQQKICPVADMPLGSMGVPEKVMVEGRAVFICCEGCRDRLLAKPDEYLAKLKTRPQSDDDGSQDDDAPDLPPIGKPRLIEPDAPPIPTQRPREVDNGSGQQDRTADARGNQRGPQQ